MPSPFLRAAFLVALALALPAPLTGQAVEGRVVDPEGAAVEGATLMLLDGEYRTVDQAVSGSDGAYRLEASSDGEYTVVIQLEGHATQTSEPFTLTSGEPLAYDVTLAGQEVGRSALAETDTLDDATLVARAVSDACREDFLPAMHGILFGAVLDSASAAPVAGAEAVVEFDGPSGLGGRGPIRVRANESGIYLVCTAPAGRPLTVRAEAAGMRGRELDARLRAGTMRKLDLRLAVSDPDRPGAVYGTVMEQDSGEPIAGAEIRLKDTELGTVTNRRGVFRLPEVPGGLHVVTVDHLGHGHHEQAVRVLGGQAAQVQVRMSVEPVEMPPMLVSVRPRSWFSDMSGLEDRIENGFGFILTEEDFEERQPRHIADALRNVPGVRVRQSGGGISGTFTIQIRNAQTMDGRVCSPILWLDGQKIGRESDAYTSVFGPDLYAVEVYRSAAETPGEFLDQDANCGVVVAWTKRGR